MSKYKTCTIMNNYDRLLRLADLIAREGSGAITESQRQELDVWLAESEDNRELYREISDGDSLKRYCENAAQTDFDTVLGSVGRKIRRAARRRTIRRAGTAAAVFVVGAAAWMLIAQRPESQIAAGVTQATLVMPDGLRIELGEREQEEGWQRHVQQDNAVVEEQAQSVRIEVPRGGEYRLTLEDGTKVWLNSETQIEYPLHFSGDSRTLSLSGEAFFDVARDSLRPFEIAVPDGVSIAVLGTRFNVRSYDDACDVQVTLLEGAVAVSHEGERLELHSDQQAVFDRSSLRLSLNHVDNAEDFAGWSEGKFILGNRNIGEVMKQFERWYDITVVYEYRPAHHFGGSISRRMDLADALDLLRATGAVDFRIDGKTVTVKSPQKKPAEEKMTLIMKT